MMTKIVGACLRALLVASLVVLNFSLPARAQYFQGNVITGAAGSANAQTGTVSNATSYASIKDVLLIYTPAASNTGSATIALSGLGGVLSGGPIAFEKPNGAGLTALVGGELVTGQPVLIRYDGTYMDVLGPVTLPINAVNLGNSALGFNAPPNLQINNSVSANALTIYVSTVSSPTAPVNASASNPIPFNFRDVTIAYGDPVTELLTAAQSLTIASGNTMGCVSGKMCRLRLYEINNSGTLGLCAYNSLSGTSIKGLNEQNLQTSQSGTSGGSSAQLLYCNISSVTSMPVREIGYLDIEETVAGTWGSVATYQQLIGPGYLKANSSVQQANFGVSSPSSNGSGTPTATTTTVSITPTSAADIISARADGVLEQAASSGLGSASAQIYRTISGGSATAIGTQQQVGANNGGNLTDNYSGSPAAWDAPNTTLSTAYTVDIWSNNGTASYPATGNSLITVEERAP